MEMGTLIDDTQTVVVSDKVKRISTQAEEIFNGSRCHWDTYFYKVVLAGNVKVIKEVVAHMEKEGSREALDWLFKRNQFEEMRHFEQKKSKRLLIVRIMTVILLSLMNILITPVFYGLHLLLASSLNRRQRRISANIQLPLAYAAFSHSQDMFVFFLSQGVDIDHTDHRGNNVFHYISDLSSVAADKAIQIFQNMVREIDDRDSVKKLLEHERNSAGLTALEYAAKFGSPSLLNQILNQPSIMHHTSFSASEEEVVFNGNDENYEAGSLGTSSRVELVDVSMYEAGSLANQSTLLNILSDRDVANMRRTDLKIFNKTHFIGQWLILKCKQMICKVLTLQLCDFILTCMMVYVLASTFIGQNGPAFHKWVESADRGVQVKELTEMTKNTSFMLKEQPFHSRINSQRLFLQHVYIRESMFHSNAKQMRRLLNNTALWKNSWPNISEVTDDELAMFLGTMNDKNIDILYENMHSIPEFANHTKTLQVIRLFPKILVLFAQELIKRKSEFLDGVNSLVNNMDNIVTKLYANFTIPVGNDIITPSSGIRWMDIFVLICPMARGYELRQTSPSFEFNELLDHIDVCLFHATMDMLKDNACKGIDQRDLAYMALEQYRPRLPSMTQQVVLVCAYLYVILDMTERCVFLAGSLWHQTSFRDMIVTAMDQKVPGSYVRKQLNIFSSFAIIIQYHVEQYIEALDSRELMDKTHHLTYQSYVSMLFISAIVVRCLMHIHSLRLLPSIGHFVIITFMMGTNLLHFSAVFVVLIFSVLFHILIDDPDCPLEKSAGFITMQESVFSTFKLTFAHGDMEAFFSTAPVQLTYVLFVIIVGLLLLNLIIAIMSTTAMEIMAEPWKGALWKVEWLDEATSAEFTFSVVTLPFRRLKGLFGYLSHKKAGYLVKSLPNGKYKIFIECFQCPVLQEEQ